MGTRRGLGYNGTTWVSAGFGIGINGSPAELYRIMYSTDDGATWTNTSGPAGFINTLQDVAANNDIFVIAAGTSALTSTDGITWTERTTGAVASLTSAHWSGEEFILVGSSSAVVAFSANGITWSTASTSDPSSLVSFSIPFRQSWLVLHAI